MHKTSNCSTALKDNGIWIDLQNYTICDFVKSECLKVSWISYFHFMVEVWNAGENILTTECEQQSPGSCLCESWFKSWSRKISFVTHRQHPWFLVTWKSCLCSSALDLSLSSNMLIRWKPWPSFIASESFPWNKRHHEIREVMDNIRSYPSWILTTFNLWKSKCCIFSALKIEFIFPCMLKFYISMWSILSLNLGRLG